MSENMMTILGLATPFYFCIVVYVLVGIVQITDKWYKDGTSKAVAGFFGILVVGAMTIFAALGFYHWLNWMGV